MTRAYLPAQEIKTGKVSITMIGYVLPEIRLVRDCHCWYCTSSSLMPA